MRRSLLPLLFLASCSKGPEADLPSVSEARSLGAEWAMVNEQANERGVTTVYVKTMRKQLREQLRSAANSLTRPDRPYGQEINALLRQPEDSAPEALRMHVAKLKQIEDQLESA